MCKNKFNFQSRFNEKIISFHFGFNIEKLNDNTSCKISNKFHIVEEKLIEEYAEYVKKCLLIK